MLLYAYMPYHEHDRIMRTKVLYIPDSLCAAHAITSENLVAPSFASASNPLRAPVLAVCGCGGGCSHPEAFQVLCSIVVHMSFPSAGGRSRVAARAGIEG